MEYAIVIVIFCIGTLLVLFLKPLVDSPKEEEKTLSLKSKTERQLVRLAEQSLDDDTANMAMKELRERFDETYGWCYDCDGAVCKEKDCCLNREDKP